MSLRCVIPSAIFITWEAALIGAESPQARTASSAFQKVETSRDLAPKDSEACIQAQSAWLKIARPAERSIAHYRMGYCSLRYGAASGDTARYQQAQREFAASFENLAAKDKPRSSAAFGALQAILSLAAAGKKDIDAKLLAELTVASDGQICVDHPVITADFCKTLMAASRFQLGWTAFGKGDLQRARQMFLSSPESAWTLWLSGRQALEARHAPDALSFLEKALTRWTIPGHQTLPEVLGPKPDLGRLYLDLGLAHYLAADYAAAITSFDESARRSPSNYVLYARARAKDNLGLRQAALADYELMGANAAGQPLDSMARFYRGILLFQRKDYKNAELEFSGALAAPEGEIRRAEIADWRALAVTANGKCDKHFQARATSILFPRAEAEAFELDCELQKCATLEQLLAWEQQLGDRAEPLRSSALNAQVAAAYVKEGVSAEDRKDSYSAVLAYRKALFWNPKDGKARFNLAAIYLGDRKFQQAEAEYRALIQADPRDYEAQYWLGQSILSQRPGPERKSEACAMLRRSLQVSDEQRRKQFAAALAAARCLN